MLRAAAWTAGLFAVGGMICHFFPGPWIEPLVLIALGAAMLGVAGRGPSQARATATPAPEAPPEEAGASRDVAR